MFFESVAYAMGMPPAGGQAQNPLMSFLPLILMFAVFYFLAIRPQQKKAKEHKQFLADLTKGQYVLTGGGMYGRIINVDGDVITVELAENLQVKVNRNFIAGSAEAATVKGEKKADKKAKKAESKSDDNETDKNEE